MSTGTSGSQYQISQPGGKAQKSGCARILRIVQRTTLGISLAYLGIGVLERFIGFPSGLTNLVKTFSVINGSYEAIKDLADSGYIQQVLGKLPVERRKKYNYNIYSQDGEGKWADWVKYKLDQQDYTGDVNYAKPEKIRDFSRQIQDARESSNVILVILPPFYPRTQILENEQIEMLKRMHREHRCVIVQTSELIPALRSLQCVDLHNMDEAEAGRRLLNSLPAQLGEPKGTPAVSGTPAPAAPPFPGRRPVMLNVPHFHPFFTGRAAQIEEIRQKLENQGSNNGSRRLWIVGPRGAGTTRLAGGWAHQDSSPYEKVVWINMESRAKTLESMRNIMKLTGMSSLPILTAGDHDRARDEIVEWLSACPERWLLVLDGVGNLAEVNVNAFIPGYGRGDVLLTSYQDRADPAHTVQVQHLTDDDGALFLIRASGYFMHWLPQDKVKFSDICDGAALPSALSREAHAAYESAKEISRAMGNMPFKLVHAAACISKERYTLEAYLEAYTQERRELEANFPHIDDRTVAWIMSFRSMSVKARALLRLCAFLSSDSHIPVELFTQVGEVAAVYGPLPAGLTFADELQSFNELANNGLVRQQAIGELYQNCLIQSADPKVFAMNRIMQEALKDDISDDETALWAELAVRVVNRRFPDVEFERWQQCKSYIAHARVCVEYIQQRHFTTPEAIRLLSVAGQYLVEQGYYEEAKGYLADARALLEQQGVSDERLLDVCHYQGRCLYRLAEYAEAEKCYKRAREICDSLPEISQKMRNLIFIRYRLARLYNDWAPAYEDKARRYEDQADQCEQAALQNAANTPDYQTRAEGYRKKAKECGDKAANYKKEAGDHCDAIRTSIGERTASPSVLNILGWVYFQEGKQAVDSGTANRAYLEARRLYLGALYLSKKAHPGGHPDEIQSYINLALLYSERSYKEEKRKKFVLAQDYLIKTVEKAKVVLGSDHPQVGFYLMQLAEFYISQGNSLFLNPMTRESGKKCYLKAQEKARQAVTILEFRLGPHHKWVFKAKRLWEDMRHRNGA